MCEPTTILLAGAALVGAYATYQSGQVQQDFANYEAKQGEADAKAEQGAAQVEAERIRKAGKQAVAEANVAMADSGVRVTSAGAMAINKDIYRGAEEDALFALLGGRDRAQQLNSQAGLTRARGKAAAQGATLGAFSTLMAGGAQASSAWRTYQQRTG